MGEGRARDALIFVGVAKIKTEYFRVIAQVKQFSDKVREPRLRLFKLGTSCEGRWRCSCKESGKEGREGGLMI